MLAGIASLAPTVQVYAQSQQVPSGQRALLTRYCTICHNSKLQVAGLVLDETSIENPSQDAALWEKVVKKLRARQMPPSGLPRPDNSSYESLVTHLETELDRMSTSAPNPGRSASFHRLNRAQYANAVQDLLGLTIDAEALLPLDDAGHGFDNLADMLTVSPVLVERYLAAAESVSRRAIGDPSAPMVIENYDVSGRLMQDSRMSESLPFGSRGGIAINHHFPADGEYLLKVRLQRNKDGYIRGLAEPSIVDVRLNGESIRRFTVGGEHKGRSGPVNSFVTPDYRGDPEQEKYEFLADDGLEVRFTARAGSGLIGVTFLAETLEPEGELTPALLYSERLSYKGGLPAIDRVVVAGPFKSTGLADSESRKRIFICRPATASQEDPCARRIMLSLARRAYRRPVVVQDIEPLRSLYQQARQESGWEAGITAALERMLVSPEFLFRAEKDPVGAKPGQVYQVSELELASRLSFFLWNSIPDEELLKEAEARRLKNPPVLEAQVRRMLADPRAEEMIRNFSGQWLSLRNLGSISPDPKVYPEYDENLRDALRQETELFFIGMLREDRSLLDILRADYTYLNERLARHYGISNVYGSGFRRVPLVDPNRRGLLGHGSILTVSSYANRTAPTLRGKWLLGNLLGTPPPEPPPDVPSLKDSGDRQGRILSMRERMEEHRVNPACSNCHKLMDPLGFALENFDALGKWRNDESGVPIDSTGELPDGTKFKGPAELREILLDNPDQLARTVVERLLTYSLGRGLEYYDAPAVRKVVRDAAPSDFRWTSLIVGIVKSVPFQMRRARTP